MSGTLLDRLVEPRCLSTVFQPIFEAGAGGWRLHAYECLTRGPAGTNLRSPEVLFEYARRKHAEAEVDRACVAAALRSAAVLPAEPRLSLNVHASTLGRDHEFAVFLGDTAQLFGIRLDRLIVEIVESVFAWDRRYFLNALDGLRAVGVRIALDDVGKGHSNYAMVLDSRPDYLKIDRYFVHGCSQDFYRQAILDSVAELGRRFAAQVVAEGVESEADLATVQRLGIDHVQGWLLGRAEPADEGLARSSSRLTGC